VIKLGLIGVGRWGTNIQRTLESFSECIVQTATKDYLKLIDENLDGILIATPGSTHFEIAKPFIAKGLAVFIEKPLTTSYADAKKIEQLAHESGSIITVGHIHLYNPAYLKTKELAQQSGQLRFLYFEGMNNGPYRDDMSALWDWAPHDIAMALDLIGEMPRHVQAWGINSLRPKKDLHDLATLKLTFANNITALSTVSWLMPEKRKKLTIVAEKNSIIFDDTAQKKVIFYENMGPAVSNDTVTHQEPQVSYPEYSVDSPLKLELEVFLETIKSKEISLTALSQGIQVVKIIEAAHKSIELDGMMVGC